MRNSRPAGSAGARGADRGRGTSRRAYQSGAVDHSGDLLGGLQAGTFLRRYWQKQPKLLRRAIPDFQTFLSKDELFKLACRDNVESRLVLQRGGDYPWQAIHGPFRLRDFRGLPRSDWTLLVQNVDLHCVAGAELRRRFSFVPNWRIDDLMVSYAPPGGSVGAHLDSYDVFLLQTLGRRRWLINPRDYTEEDFIEGLDLRIIGGFHARKQWLLEPGDMLYLPPGVAHHGIAETECMTYSIGFRAPGGRELALHFLEGQGVADDRYRDPDLRVQSHPGEIAAAHLARIRSLIRGAVSDNQALNRWFGCFMTTLPEGIAPPLPRRRMTPRSFLQLWRKRGTLYRAHPSRALFLREKNGIVLFVNGESSVLPLNAAGLVQAYTDEWQIDIALLRRRAAGAPVIESLCKMYNAGVLVARAPQEPDDA